MALQDNLKDARGRMGMSQELVAERLGISRQAVTKWEAGQSRPSARNLQALAELYQCPVEELLADTEQKGPNLILRANLTRIAITAQAVLLYSCTQVIFQLRRADDLNRPILQVELGMFLTLLLLSSIWMAWNHRYESDKDQRRKNTKIESVYCWMQAAIGLLTIYFGMGLVGFVLILTTYAIYVLYINPKFMNRELNRKLKNESP